VYKILRFFVRHFFLTQDAHRRGSHFSKSFGDRAKRWNIRDKLASSYTG